MNNVQDALLVEVHADQANHERQADALILLLLRGNSFRHIFNSLIKQVLLSRDSEDHQGSHQGTEDNQPEPGPAQFIHKQKKGAFRMKAPNLRACRD